MVTLSALVSQNLYINLPLFHPQLSSILSIYVGPAKITTFHPMATVWLDSTKNELTKTDWYVMVLPRTSTIFTRDEDEHTARRRLWDHVSQK